MSPKSYKNDSPEKPIFMNFISEDLLHYCEKHSSPESDLLHTLNRETHLKASSPRMLSGHLQGRLLAMLSSLFNPRRILEIGTYTGYSALCLAEGLTPDGLLISIDPNEETNAFASEFISRSPLASKIDIRTGKAQDIIPELNEEFDLIFIDADKKNYSLYFDLVAGKVRKGGLIIADNVLWSGKVLEKIDDADTKALVEFNKKVADDGRFGTVMLPVRDGLSLIRRH